MIGFSLASNSSLVLQFLRELHERVLYQHSCSGFYWDTTRIASLAEFSCGSFH